MLAQDSDLVELIDFATDVFNGLGPGDSRGLLQRLTTDQILIARDQGKLVGFCLHNGYEGVAERFGPFGVDPMQGKGLGKILLYDCLALMRAQGRMEPGSSGRANKARQGICTARPDFM